MIQKSIVSNSPLSVSSPSVVPRTDLFVTTSLEPARELVEEAYRIARELNAPVVLRGDKGLSRLFAAHPNTLRALVVQTERLLLAARTGEEFFYHPNMAFLRLKNLLRGERDLLIEAAQLQPGDRVLDATLGHASEAILCAHVVGKSGIVHGVEAVPELGMVVRDGLKRVVTENLLLNALMRQVEVVHLGHHLAYLRGCKTGGYDVVCFDPFFDVILPDSETFIPLRAFGEHAPLLPEALIEAQRVAQRRVLVKAARRSDALENLGITNRVESRSGKVVYGVLPGSSA